MEYFNREICFFHIHQCQEVHNSLLIQKNLNSARKIKALNPKFFEIPLTLNDYQKFIQCCDLGREQIFSVLLKQNFSKSKILFYKKKISYPIDKKKEKPTSKKNYDFILRDLPIFL